MRAQVFGLYQKLFESKLESLLVRLYHAMNFLVTRFPKPLFLDPNTAYCQHLCYYILYHSNCPNGTIRARAAGLMYQLMRANYDVARNLSRVKSQAAMAVSRLVGEEHLRDAVLLSESLAAVHTKARNQLHAQNANTTAGSLSASPSVAAMASPSVDGIAAAIAASAPGAAAAGVQPEFVVAVEDVIDRVRKLVTYSTKIASNVSLSACALVGFSTFFHMYACTNSSARIYTHTIEEDNVTQTIVIISIFQTRPQIFLPMFVCALRMMLFPCTYSFTAAAVLTVALVPDIEIRSRNGSGSVSSHLVELFRFARSARHVARESCVTAG